MVISQSCSTMLCRVPFLEDYFDSGFFETTLSAMQLLLTTHIRQAPHLIPFFCSVPGRYRSTVHATCLFSLYKAGCLQAQDVEVLQNQILSLRTKAVQNDPTPAPKFDVLPEDKDAWCVTETPSVWSTSYSIWSLIETGYDGPQKDAVTNACRWLTRQALTEGGWGYNLYPSTPPTVYLTSLAIKALVHCIRNATSLGLSHSDVAEANKKIRDGVAFILKCRCANAETPVPLFKTRPDGPDTRHQWDLASTIWGYQIILEHGQRPQRDTVEKHRGALFDYLLEHIPPVSKNIPISFVDETLIKYQRSRKYQYYQPSLLINLLKIGLSPLHPLAFSFLDWLKTTIRPDGVASDYHPTNATSFATALAIQTIHAWTAAVAKSIDPIQEASQVAHDAFPKVKQRLQEAEEKQQAAEKKVDQLTQKETTLMTVIVVLAVLIVASLTATAFLLVDQPNIGVGILGSLIGGLSILALERSVSYILKRRRRRE